MADGDVLPEPPAVGDRVVEVDEAVVEWSTWWWRCSRRSTSWTTRCEIQTATPTTTAAIDHQGDDPPELLLALLGLLLGLQAGLAAGLLALTLLG